MKPMRFSKTECVLLLGAIIVLILLLNGCAGRGSNQSTSADDPLTGVPALIQRISLVFTGLATVALFLCGVALWFIADKASVAKYAIIALTVLIVAGLLHWLAMHWAWAIGISGALLVAGIVGYAYLHKKDVRRRVCRALNTPVK